MPVHGVRVRLKVTLCNQIDIAAKFFEDLIVIIIAVCTHDSNYGTSLIEPGRPRNATTGDSETAAAKLEDPQST